jgi:hypothetical protein
MPTFLGESMGKAQAKVFAFLLAFPTLAAEQQPEQTQRVEAGSRYRAGLPFRILFGSQWREEWTTPMVVPLLDLDAFDGGLSPFRRGGGLQTKNLRLRSANGNVWVFRSIDKDPTRVFDPELRASLVADIFQDLTSTAHPAAPLVVAPLLDAVDLLHGTPRLVIMPDHPRLGEFREFAGVLGMIEQRLERGYAGSNKAMSTLDLFARLESRSDEQVDARDYLRARLIDLLVSDWDRHVDQWRWLRFDVGDTRVWRPVPRDRDQAFSRFDGIVPSLAEYYTKQLVSFGPKFPAIEKLTFSARFIDRRFLVRLSRTEWEAVTAEVVGRLTDERIAAAVRNLPAEMHAKGGAALEASLRACRDGLSAAAREFYLLLADIVDVHATEGPDHATLTSERDGAVALSLRVLDQKTGKPAGAPFFQRTFLPDETSEVRLYLLGGGDVVEEKGEDRKIAFRIVRERPPDRSPSPATSAAPDDESSTSGDARETALELPDDQIHRRYEPVRDWGHDLFFFPQLSFDPTRGLVAGARALLTRFSFGKEPFAEEMNFAAAWSTGTNHPRLEYNADVRTGTPVQVLLYAAYSGMDFANFFGLGNETVRDPARVASGFYTLRQEQLVFHPGLQAPLFGPLRARAGVMLKHVSDERDTPIAATGAYGFGEMTLASGEIGLSLDTTTGKLTRQRGFKLEVIGRYYPHLFDASADFGKVRAEASAQLGSDVLPAVGLSLRAAGEKNWGTYPFFEAALLGGAASRLPLDLTSTTSGNLLRGFDLNRFAGDASVAANAELRIALGRYSAILPLRFGVLGLADVGRVFLASETSRKWHLAAGGGLWLALRAVGRGFETVSAFNVALVRSDEGTAFYLSTGFGL